MIKSALFQKNFQTTEGHFPHPILGVAKLFFCQALKGTSIFFLQATWVIFHSKNFQGCHTTREPQLCLSTVRTTSTCSAAVFRLVFRKCYAPLYLPECRILLGCSLKHNSWFSSNCLPARTGRLEWLTTVAVGFPTNIY